MSCAVMTESVANQMTDLTGNRRVIRIMVTLVIMLCASSASAEVGDERVAAARAHDERARELFAEGDFVNAMGEMQAAQALSASPVRLYNMAACHEQLGQIPEAVDLYERFLNDMEAPPERRQRAQVRIEALRSELRESVGGGEPGEGGSAQALETERRRLSPTAFYTTLVVTLAMGVAAVVLGGVTLAEHSEWEGQTRLEGVDDDATLHDRGEALALATDVLIGVTSAAAIATLVLGLLTDWSGRTGRASLRPRLSRSFLGLVGRF